MGFFFRKIARTENPCRCFYETKETTMVEKTKDVVIDSLKLIN